MSSVPTYGDILRKGCVCILRAYKQEEVEEAAGPGHRCDRRHVSAGFERAGVRVSSPDVWSRAAGTCPVLLIHRSSPLRGGSSSQVSCPVRNGISADAPVRIYGGMEGCILHGVSGSGPGTISLGTTGRSSIAASGMDDEGSWAVSSAAKKLRQISGGFSMPAILTRERRVCEEPAKHSREVARTANELLRAAAEVTSLGKVKLAKGKIQTE
ncbi:hypothetical protein Bbelb_134970 [Branchiostoma belcheri]|nr:hypothetical protein Bbelb_134970 [Branchiostoma belcheri]